MYVFWFKTQTFIRLFLHFSVHEWSLNAFIWFWTWEKLFQAKSVDVRSLIADTCKETGFTIDQCWIWSLTQFFNTSFLKSWKIIPVIFWESFERPVTWYIFVLVYSLSYIFWLKSRHNYGWSTEHIGVVKIKLPNIYTLKWYTVAVDIKL